MIRDIWKALEKCDMLVAGRRGRSDFALDLGTRLDADRHWGRWMHGALLSLTN